MCIRDRLQRVRVRRNFLGGLKPIDGLLPVAGFPFELGEVNGDFLKKELVVFYGFRIFGPFMQSKLPDVSRATGVVIIFVVKLAQLEQNLVAVRIISQSLAQKGFGFPRLVEVHAHKE